MFADDGRDVGRRPVGRTDARPALEGADGARDLAVAKRDVSAVAENGNEFEVKTRNERKRRFLEFLWILMKLKPNIVENYETFKYEMFLCFVFKIRIRIQNEIKIRFLCIF